ncbi:hypothetical protein BS47DRAFT_893028 [Hydnum rufescens UP504]|uniref:arginyltransferase n=1 Tax=Hydnum rufescens UP504 TaxID=1448309 RepID=A0A9P6AYA4_9AGAM|nr:hypothetical protein BS47DRAFT_893028 [Hydnum rufescens UP504]
MGVPTIIDPLGYRSGTCGYCSEPGKRSVESSSYSTGAWPLQMTCDVYQRMIDRGWRRSGEYLYKPDLLHSCCPQYTIRLGALEFSPSKNQRKIVSKWNRFVMGEGSPKGKKPAKHPPAFSLVEALHASEAAFLAPNAEPLHKFTVTLELPSFTQEKYNLYCRYQSEVHKDYDKSSANLSRFLIDNPLHRAPIPYMATPPGHLPSHYGAYHQVYRLDGELIAFGVVDVLPNCISSVYLVYSPEWAWASLGKLSALYEIALVHEINRCGIEDMKWQYMGRILRA